MGYNVQLNEDNVSDNANGKNDSREASDQGRFDAQSSPIFGAR